ncbi:TetR/AcrR family transcriptional regulator [Phaeacidiphilus oryzae]|uniref:TetR/AcrR family transcriptional regulator n=1 Tax=Phaeacidiphilus oryzae TaxID=348818 RepID=UPI001378C108|nr:TetR/AcrR family transcriptional regulator [Phaeacidiphilus oryzae]
MDTPDAPRKRRSPAPGERQRDAERTRERILDAAVEIFSAKGPAGARVAEIARRAGVNQQLISYYFDGKDGLYREIGRRWRAYEAQAIPDDLDLGEQVRRGVRASVDPRFGGRLLAWEGLTDSEGEGEGEAGPDAEERDARLRHEVERIRERQRAGEVDDRIDPAALLLITISAGNALAVYPQLARALFGAAADSPEVVDRYAEELASAVGRLAEAGRRGGTTSDDTPGRHGPGAPVDPPPPAPR